MSLRADERHALLFHAAFLGTAGLALVLTFPWPVGWTLFALVVAYNLALPLAALRLGHRSWLRLWTFLLPLSVLQVFPDAFLSTVLGVLEFPDLGFPRFAGVSLFMAGMWIIPLFAIASVGLAVEARRDCVRAAGTWTAVTSLAVFAAAEATLTRIPVWHARDVTVTGPLAHYVLVPEMLLGLSAFLAYRSLGRARLAPRLAAAFALMVLYLGNLAFFYLVLEALPA